jgi:hypothetical protein
VFRSKCPALTPDFATCPIWPELHQNYLLKHEVFEVRHLSIKSQMGQSLPSFERRPVDDNLLPEILFKMSFGHVLLLRLNLVVDQYIDQSLNLVPWYLQLLLNSSYILFSQ